MKILILLSLIYLHTACFALDKSSFVGAWHDTDTKTVIILFADGNMLFTFLNPPLDEPTNDWHNNGTWELSSPGEVKVSFTKMSNVTKPLIYRYFEGGLISPDGPIYERVGTGEKDSKK
jgi:hypothetical protein